MDRLFQFWGEIYVIGMAVSLICLAIILVLAIKTRIRTKQYYDFDRSYDMLKKVIPFSYNKYHDSDKEDPFEIDKENNILFVKGTHSVIVSNLTQEEYATAVALNNGKLESDNPNKLFIVAEIPCTAITEDIAKNFTETVGSPGTGGAGSSLGMFYNRLANNIYYPYPYNTYSNPMMYNPYNPMDNNIYSGILYDDSPKRTFDRITYRAVVNVTFCTSDWFMKNADLVPRGVYYIVGDTPNEDYILNIRMDRCYNLIPKYVFQSYFGGEINNTSLYIESKRRSTYCIKPFRNLFIRNERL